MTKHADLCFYAELRDFPPSGRYLGLVTRSFGVAGSVKDMIEASGVPHAEIEVILVDRAAIDFSYRIQGGDRISV